MTAAPERVQAALASPFPRTGDLERALIGLGNVLDPTGIVQSPHHDQVFNRALELFAALNLCSPRVEAEGAQLAECLRSIAGYAYFSGRALQGLAPSQRAVDLHRRLGNRPELHKALSLRGALLADTGNLPVAIETYAEALEIAVDLGDAMGEAKICNNLGVALIYAAQPEDAIRCYERALTLAKHAPVSAYNVGSAFANIAMACLHLEDYARGVRAAQQAVEVMARPTTTAALYSRVLAESNYTWLLLEVDAPDKARQRCELAKHFARECGLERANMEADMASALCEVHAGAVDAGLGRLSTVVQRARVQSGALAEILIAMVRANEMAGRYDMALVYLRELMEHTRQVQHDNALLHHRLHMEQLGRKQRLVAGHQDLMARREDRLRGQLVQQVSQQELMKARLEILERLAASADLRGGGSEEHSYRVAKLAALLAQVLGWDADTLFVLELAVRLHDIGRIGIPERLLMSRRRLTQAEMDLAQSHTTVGADILAQSDTPHMKMAEEIARFHHERWDGGGYPFGLTGSAIPLAARITALADAYDELTHSQGRESARSPPNALQEIAAQRGRWFDPQLTDLFVALVARLQGAHRDLDAYLGRAASESPFIRARQKIAASLQAR